MQISSVNNYQYSRPQFKSAIPVYHWVAEANGSYAPLSDVVENRKLQKKLLKYLNKTIKKPTPYQKKVTDALTRYMYRKDAYYQRRVDINYKLGEKKTLCRNPFNDDGGWEADGKFEPINYLITGLDVDRFNDEYTKDLGYYKSTEPDLEGKRVSEDKFWAIIKYVKGALEFVKAPERQIRDNAGIPQGLHTKFEIIRDSDGKPVDYRFVDMKFLPESGSKNPFERLKLRRG